MFSRHGTPKLLFTDNGPHFAAGEFAEFSRKWDFAHDTSPHYPKSNGLVERTVQAVKKTLKKTFKQDEDLYLALLVLNTTPSEDGTSPALKLYGRQPRKTLPSAKETANIPLKRKTKHKERYDSQAKDLPDIIPRNLCALKSRIGLRKE